MDEKNKINHEDLLAQAFHDHVKREPITETTGFDLSGLIPAEPPRRGADQRPTQDGDAPSVGELDLEDRDDRKSM